MDWFVFYVVLFVGGSVVEHFFPYVTKTIEFSKKAVAWVKGFRR